MWKWIKSLLPFRMSYWVVLHKSSDTIMVIRQRTSPGNEGTYGAIGFLTLDGPHHDQEDAARSLAFWRHQYKLDEQGATDWD